MRVSHAVVDAYNVRNFVVERGLVTLMIRLDVIHSCFDDYETVDFTQLLLGLNFVDVILMSLQAGRVGNRTLVDNSHRIPF